MCLDKASSLPILKIMVIHLAMVLPVAVPAFQVSCKLETNPSSDPKWTAILSSANTFNCLTLPVLFGCQINVHPSNI